MSSPFQRLLQEMETLRTSAIPLVRWHHKICLLAVVLDEKPAFALGFDEPFSGSARVFFHQKAPVLGLKLRETPMPPRRYLAHASLPCQVTAAIEEKWTAESEQRTILWLFKRSQVNERIDALLAGETSVHHVLGYPRCCSDAYERDQASVAEAYYAGLKERHGSASPDDIVAMIKANITVIGGVPAAERVAKTMLRLPFIPFVACNDCLASRQSPAAHANQRFGSILAMVSPSAVAEVRLQAIGAAKTIEKRLHSRGKESEGKERQ